METDHAKNLIDYIVKHTDLSQAALANRLKVSRAQVSKWKAGEYISSERKSELLKLAGLFDTVCVDWAMFAKSEQNALAWYSYFFEILEDVEWGDTLKDFFHDMSDIYVGHFIDGLCTIGAKIDPQAPTTRWIDAEECEPTPLASAVFSILEAWCQLKDWMDDTLEFDDLTSAAEADLFDVTQDLEWLAFDLALSHVDRSALTFIGVDEAKLDAAVAKSRNKIQSHLHDICQIRTKHGLPITANYFQLLHLSPIELAEQSWFRPGGFLGNDDEDLIMAYLPYGQRLILTHLKCSAIALGNLDEKLDRLLATSQ